MAINCRSACGTPSTTGCTHQLLPDLRFQQDHDESHFAQAASQCLQVYQQRSLPTRFSNRSLGEPRSGKQRIVDRPALTPVRNELIYQQLCLKHRC